MEASAAGGGERARGSAKSVTGGGEALHVPYRELKALDHERTGWSTKNTKPHPFSPVKLDQEDHRCKLLSYHYNKCIGVGLLCAGKCLSLKTWKKYHGVDNSGYLNMEAFMNLIWGMSV